MSLCSPAGGDSRLRAVAEPQTRAGGSSSGRSSPFSDEALETADPEVNAVSFASALGANSRHTDIYLLFNFSRNARIYSEYRTAQVYNIIKNEKRRQIYGLELIGAPPMVRRRQKSKGEANR